MGSPLSIERIGAPNEELQDGKNGTTFAPLEEESRRIALDFENALKRHEQADHFAGLSDFALAQELIDYVGRDRFIRAVREVRSKGREYFYEVLCALIPSAKGRLQFYEPVLAKAQEQRMAARAALAGTNGNGTPHKPEHAEDEGDPPSEREAFILCCRDLDRLLRFTPTQAAKLLMVRYSPQGRAEKLLEENGLLLRPHFHFTSIKPDQFDTTHIVDVLQRSGDNLQEFRKTETGKFETELQRLRTKVEPVLQRLKELRVTIREEILASEDNKPKREEIAKLRHDLPILLRPLAPSEEQPRAVLESAIGKNAQGAIVEAVRRRIGIVWNSIDQEVAERTAPIRKILALIPQILKPDRKEQDPSALPESTRTSARGRNGHDSDTGAHTLAPVTKAAM